MTQPQQRPHYCKRLRLCESKGVPQLYIEHPAGSLLLWVRRKQGVRGIRGRDAGDFTLTHLNGQVWLQTTRHLCELEVTAPKALCTVCSTSRVVHKALPSDLPRSFFFKLYGTHHLPPGLTEG